MAGGQKKKLGKAKKMGGLDVKKTSPVKRKVFFTGDIQPPQPNVDLYYNNEINWIIIK